MRKNAHNVFVSFFHVGRPYGRPTYLREENMFVSSICRNNLIISKEAMPIILSNYVKKDEDGDDMFDFERIVPIGNVPDCYQQRLDKWSSTLR